MATKPDVSAKPALDFPFVELNLAEAAFGQVPNYDEVLAALPEQFKSWTGKWGHAASNLHMGGWTKERQQKAIELFITEEAEVAKAQIAYLDAWLANFKPKMEQKYAVGGWLLSLMFSECPDW